MKMQDMFNKMNICEILLDSVVDKLGESCKAGWDLWENHSIEYFFNYPHKDFNLEETKYIVTGSWCFDRMSFERIGEILCYANEHGINILAIPEMSIFILCKDKEALKEAYKKLPQEMAEVSTPNLVDIEESDNGITFKYTTKVSFREFEQRPDYVYELIKEEREKENEQQ